MRLDFRSEPAYAPPSVVTSSWGKPLSCSGCGPLLPAAQALSCQKRCSCCACRILFQRLSTQTCLQTSLTACSADATSPAGPCCTICLQHMHTLRTRPHARPDALAACSRDVMRGLASTSPPACLDHRRCRHQARAVPEASARTRRCTSQPAPPAPPAPAQTPLNLTELPVPAALASVFGVRLTQAQPPEGGVSFAYRGRTWWCARRLAPHQALSVMCAAA